VSGNPKGRPKGRTNLKSAARKLFTSLVVLRQGDRTCRITRLEGIFWKQVEKALQGDYRAAQTSIQWAEKLGLFREPDRNLALLTDEELQQLEAIAQKVDRG
jgi:Family of unknown function (DUF5681)